MRELKFWKYQGTGNDFIMIDGRNMPVKFSVSEIKRLCDRRFGIGADGLIILKPHDKYDFEMDYYNSDGSQSFCGNGSRCAQAFAKALGMIENQSVFVAIDSVHHGRMDKDWYETKMGDVNKIDRFDNEYFLNTGSPHHIVYVENIDEVDVQGKGAQIRYSEKYKVEGTNVNFVEVDNEVLKVRTYERGVEGETFSCGTGVTAVALAHTFKTKQFSKSLIRIKTKGGQLAIKFIANENETFRDIWLCGPAELVYQGHIKLH